MLVTVLGTQPWMESAGKESKKGGGIGTKDKYDLTKIFVLLAVERGP